jgi:hypothetical protein
MKEKAAEQEKQAIDKKLKVASKKSGVFGDGRYLEALKRVVKHYCLPTPRDFCEAAKKLQSSYSHALKTKNLKEYLDKLKQELDEQCSDPAKLKTDRCKSLKIMLNARTLLQAKPEAKALAAQDAGAVPEPEPEVKAASKNLWRWSVPGGSEACREALLLTHTT